MAESTSGGTTIADRRVADIDCSSEGAFTLQECSVNFPVGETCSAGARQFAGVVCNISSKLVRSVHGLIVLLVRHHLCKCLQSDFFLSSEKVNATVITIVLKTLVIVMLIVHV